MIILDTSIWIEHLRNNQNFFPKTSKLLENREVFAVECIFGELLQGVKIDHEKGIILNYWAHLPKKYHEDIIVESGIYSAKNKLLDKGVGLIDTIILMHGIKNNFKIWTLDNKFLKIIPKKLKYGE
jgi:predicted nucleic acid-binding protein